MQTYPGQMYPLLIKPSATEPYYTKVSLICVGIQMYPGQFDMCIQMYPNVPYLIEPSATEHYYTRSV